jgi:hypothetical protein
MMVPEVAEELYRTVEKGMREEGQRLLNHVASLLPAGAWPAHKRLAVGSPAELIVKEADQGKVDLTDGLSRNGSGQGTALWQRFTSRLDAGNRRYRHLQRTHEH